MTLETIIHGFLLFLACLSLHIVFWRIKAPVQSTLMLFVIFLLIPLAGMTITLANGISGSLMSTFLVFVLHISLSLVYIASYPAAEAQSPSLAIFFIISASPLKKLSAEEIIRQYTTRKTIIERLDDLKLNNLVYEGSHGLQLSRLARTVVRFYILYRKILGLPQGEG